MSAAEKGAHGTVSDAYAHFGICDGEKLILPYPQTSRRPMVSIPQ